MTSIKHALLSLDGLSVGDGFGAALGEGWSSKAANTWVERQQLPPGPWTWTDDTHMALSIVDVLTEFEEIDQDALAEIFAERYAEDPYRGYGRGAARILRQIIAGGDWRELAPKVFPGGSYGNGAAMRVAPLGGFHKDDLELVVREAKKSASITHVHLEGQSGAIAIAVAAAIAANPQHPHGNDFLSEVLKYIPASDTRDGVQAAMRISPDQLDTAVKRLGTGWQVSAQDTVPFCLWCAAHNLTDFEAALWQTAKGVGDRDTTCAIVGGIVALSAGAVPQTWLEHREPLPDDFEV